MATEPGQGLPHSMRDYVALMVLGVSGVGLILVSLAVVWPRAAETAIAEREVTTVFNTVVPLLGTWVGTVLAYYFSRETFESTSRSLQTVIGTLSPQQKLQSQKVKDVMLPVRRAVTRKLQPGQDDTAVLVSELLALLNDTVTRIPVLNDDGSGRYMIHGSMLNRYVTENTRVNQTSPFSLAGKTLRDFLGHAGMESMVKKVAYLGIEATMADAKAKMDAIPDCQDVFVTQTGKPEEEVQGFIMNTDILRVAQV